MHKNLKITRHFSTASLASIINHAAGDADGEDCTHSNTLFIGYSGGVDSHVLLDAVNKLIKTKSLSTTTSIIAIHINHGIHPDAIKWEKHCQKVCAQLQIPCITRKVAVLAHPCNSKKNKGLEALARKLRYQSLTDIINQETQKYSQTRDNNTAILLTAHHADDQAETLLLQLLRGAGPKGLAAIPCKSKLQPDIKLLRPLLSFSRDAIIEYAKTNHLKWIEDSSNQDTKIDRNYLRYKIIPLLKKRWSGINKTLARVAENCYETNYLAEESAAQDYAAVKSYITDSQQQSSSPQQTQLLSITKLCALSPQRQRNVLRYHLQQLNLPIPARIKIEEIQRTVLHAACDAQPIVSWDGVEVRRYQDSLYVMPPPPTHDPHIIIPWRDLTTPLVLPNNLGILEVQFLDNNQSKLRCHHTLTNITVRFRTGENGERCRLAHKKHSTTLKNLMQEWHIPPWQRSRIPLLYCGDEIVVIVGYGRCVGWEQDIMPSHVMPRFEASI
jgi:tRNA(Ile)-lysidine synthase